MRVPKRRGVKISSWARKALGGGAVGVENPDPERYPDWPYIHYCHDSHGGRHECKHGIRKCELGLFGKRGKWDKCRGPDE